MKRNNLIAVASGWGKRSGLLGVMIWILLTMQVFAEEGLTVFADNPRYLAYKGEPIFLLSWAIPSTLVWKIDDPTTKYYIDLEQMAEYGANHVTIHSALTTGETWAFANNPSSTYVNKIRTLCQQAYAKDIIVGLNIFGFNVYKYPYASSFDNEHFGGPLFVGSDDDDVKYGFLEAADAANVDPIVVASREGQQRFLRWLVDITHDFPNVYYNLFWEPTTSFFWKGKPAQTKA